MTMTRPDPSPAQSRRSQRGERHDGTRTCAGCGARVDADRVRSELVRIVLMCAPAGHDGEVLEAHVDLGARGQGRGAWIHARRDCIAKAAQRGLAKSARGAVRASAAGLEAEIGAQAARRVEGLLAAAHRTRALAVGSDPAAEALAEGRAYLFVVARDAAASASTPAVAAAERDGHALRWGDKARLGACVGRGDVGVIAVLEDGIAAALRQAIGLAETFAGAPGDGAVRQVAKV
jgi:predicted RNA-binding protein YlxR (DUF448 family)